MAVPEKLHYLFVCYANAERSPTAEAVCRRIAAENDLDIEVSSAGTSDGATRPVTKRMADLADKIFVMNRTW
jgi:protein-tyrosine-phosphatase